MLQVTVSLPSGRSESLSIPLSFKVGDLRVPVQKSLQQGFLTLVTAGGYALTDPTESVQGAIEEGDNLTAIAREAKAAATDRAFALWCSGGDRIITWGHPHYGGDSSEIQAQLRSVQHVQASGSAFAAILEDETIVTWGNAHSGGDSSEVQNQLRSVQQIQAARGAFAAIIADGSVVTWGDPLGGGDSSQVQNRLRNVRQIQAADRVFAAIREDGSVVTWGEQKSGGDSSEVFKVSWKGVPSDFRPQSYACAAIVADGSVVDLGDFHILVVTVPKFKISWLAWGSLWLRAMHLLPSLRMNPLLPGAIHIPVVTAPKSNISSVVSSRFRPQIGHLLPSWLMDR